MPKDDRRGELLIGTRATADVQPDRKTEKKGTYWPIKNFIGRAFFYFQNVKLYFKFIENKCFEGLSSVD